MLATPWSGVAVAHADAFAQLDSVPAVASPTCGGSVSAEAQVTPVQVGGRDENGVPRRDPLRRGRLQTFATGSGTIVIMLSYHPDAEIRITT